jgi:aquaporin Z
MNVSGAHLNPAVTLGLFAARKVDGPTTGAYIAAQLVGAVVGAALLKWVLPVSATTLVDLGTPAVAASINRYQAVAIEAVFTFLLMSAIFGTAVSSAAPAVGGFAIGLAVFVAGVVAGPLTGAALNPARAFGPALIALEFHAQGLYWIGPILGAMLASLLWKLVLLPKETA